MSAESGDKRMQLRYAGRCRVCGTALPAGTDAVYERSTRTVRCLECPAPAPDVGTRSAPAAEDALAPCAPPEGESTKPVASEPATPHGEAAVRSAPIPDLVAFAALRESVASARRRQRAWALGGLLAVPTALLIIPPLLSAALTALPS